ncbi:hypothetical protein M8J75_008814 [Diaphorina citri]|nr:hypothetical protein M8J75_008814 [Diaphorina citri]
MIDVTTNKLLWMLSNITSMSGDITTTQNNIFNHHAVTVREYSPPNLLRESAQASHLIQIFIFQEDSPATAFPLPPADPFYIRDWVMRSQSSNAKHLMCGPVAGLQFKVNKSTLNKDYKGLSNYVYSVAPSRGTSSWNRKFRVGRGGRKEEEGRSPKIKTRIKCHLSGTQLVSSDKWILPRPK